MFKVGDNVYIRPSSSLRFGGRWGEILNINPRRQLCVLISISNGVYAFSPDELVSEYDYNKLKDEKSKCRCGRDIKPFEEICDYCVMMEVQDN